MKFLLPVLIIALVLLLNRTYAYYYDYIKDHFQKAPAQTILSEKDENSSFIALGDSLMVGVGTGEGDESLGLLLYKAKIGNKALKYVNLAIPGSTIKQVLKEQLPRALQSRPKIVWLLAGINDVHDFTPKKEFEKDYRLIVDGLIASGGQITLINIPYLGSSSILLPPWNLFMDFQTKQYNAIIDKIAREKGLKMADLYKLSREKFIDSSDLYSGDLFHPSGRGYILWSDYINAN